MLRRIAVRSRHEATDWATARARGRSPRTSLSRVHASSGLVPLVGRWSSSSHASSTHSTRPSSVKPSSRRSRQLEQVGDVAGGVLALGLGQRPAKPVGEAITLGRVDAELAVQDRHQRRRAVPEEAPRHLSVEEHAGHGADCVGQHVEVLLGCVEHGLRIGLEEPAHDADVDGQRIDQDQLVVPGELHERQRREVRALAMELGVDRVGGLGGDFVDDGVEIGLAVDPAMRSNDRFGCAHASPVAYSRPDRIHAVVPPSTLTASIP